MEELEVDKELIYNLVLSYGFCNSITNVPSFDDFVSLIFVDNSESQTLISYVSGLYTVPFIL